MKNRVTNASIFCLLISASSIAHADAFIPTMVSANVLWIVMLPVVIGIEGWFMARQNWPNPYKASTVANILSMLAVLPIEIGLSALGGSLVGMNGSKDSLKAFFGGLLMYGWVPAPKYGFVGFDEYSSIALAAILFIGICWMFSIVIESLYYTRKYRNTDKRTIWRLTVKSHSVSYALILALWLPYSYFSARSAERDAIQFLFQSCCWWRDV